MGIVKFLKKLGPGVVAGAADDDPSGIATYALAGARFGFSMLWTAWITIPLMVCVQEMCARIGLVTKKGLVGAIVSRYGKSWVLYLLAILMFLANTLNVGADIAAMAASAKLVVPVVPEMGWSVLFVVVVGVLTIFGSYKLIARIFKWLTLVLLFYVLSAILANLNWREVMMSTLVPNIVWNKEFVMMIVALLGTTISPYLFFWQASSEVEEEKGKTVTKRELFDMRQDVLFGMTFSNVAMWFIIAATAGTLHSRGIFDIATPAQAALALEPVAGKMSAILFTIGVVGAGMLAIPVLAGSAAYTMSEAFGWREGLNKKWHQARAFYGVFAASLTLGLVMTGMGFDPIKLLFYTALVFGVISPPLILAVVVLANDKRVMGEKVNGWLSNLFGMLAFGVMSVAVAVMFWL